jgi:AraC-like DNA-binding protein
MRELTRSRQGSLDGTVRAEALRGYIELVEALGGDPVALLAHVGIAVETLNDPDSFISYRAMIALLEESAQQLQAPAFGLQLAARQGGTAVLGPLDLAMRNSSTVGEAFRYCAGHLQVYSSAIRIAIREERAAGRHIMRFDILLRDVPASAQAVENALCSTHYALKVLSGGSFGAREVWYMHRQRLPLPLYRKYLPAKIRFEAPYNAVVFLSDDLAQRIANQDPQVYALAAKYINLRYPEITSSLAERVQRLIAQQLESAGCSQQAIAAQLGLHIRTLQRQLRRQETSFDALKDLVRRDAAQQYLVNSDLPLTEVATLLGYSETSVLTRSCQRWFNCTPLTLRKRRSRRAS